MATRPARVMHGAIFTRRWVVDMMLDLAGYTPDHDLASERVVEPAIGEGAFIEPIVERLLESVGPNPEWHRLRDCIRGWDLQQSSVEVCRKRVVKTLADAGCPTLAAERLAETWLHHGDFLLEPDPGRAATLVVGNPPYIRLEDVSPNRRMAYRSALTTMGKRADVFVGFFERGLDLLAPNGRLVYICADRWMHNDYGKDLRRKIVAGFAMDVVVPMHDAGAFEAQVSAYPAVVALRRASQAGAVTVDTTTDFGHSSSRELVEWIRSGHSRTSDGVGWRGSRLANWFDTDDVWPTGSADVLEWLGDLRTRFHPLELDDKRTLIRIGVATGNDEVFVVPRDSAPPIEKSRLMPIALNDDVKSGRFEWHGAHLVDPWEARGQLIDLDRYPLAAAYLTRHRATLTRRHTAKSGKWWRTIDAVHHDRLASAYLVLEDMKGHSHPVLIPAGYYPHHNLYAIYSEAWDLDVLGGILMSEVFERQVAAYCVKMRGGTLRFQAQYVRLCRFPKPEEVPSEVAAELGAAFRARDRRRATTAALAAYGLRALPD